MTKEVHNHKEKESQPEHKKQEIQEEKEEQKLPKEQKVEQEQKEDEKEKIIKELTDKYLRALAELENFKKRVAKEKEEFIKFTRADTISEILPVLDNLERAADSIKKAKDVEAVKQGIDIILKQFVDCLLRMDVKEVETKGKVNVDFHHILAKEVREDKEEGEILEVFQKGYLYQDKLIRPALVKVAIKKSDSEPKSNN